MTTPSDSDAFDIAQNIAPDFTALLQVTDLVEQIAELKGHQERIHTLTFRDFALGDAIGMAGLLVGLVSTFLQIRAGHTFQEASEEQIKARLILKLSTETSLPADVRERLITLLIEKLPPHD